MTEVVSKSIVKVSALPTCHEGFKEVYGGLFLGKKRDVGPKLLDLIDVLVPLDSIDGDIWEDGWTFEKELFYLPVTDYGVLPVDIELKAINKLVDLIISGKKVAIFCIGGHGRTGYIASLILTLLGIVDPIKYLRESYCEKAVESRSQIKAIANFCGVPEFETKYKSVYSYNWYESYGTDGYKTIGYKYVDTDKCSKCNLYNALELKSGKWGFCEYFGKTVSGDDKTCTNMI